MEKHDNLPQKKKKLTPEPTLMQDPGVDRNLYTATAGIMMTEEPAIVQPNTLAHAGYT